MINYEWLTIRILVGLPGSGKTTFIKNTIEDEYNAVFDDILSPADVTQFKNTCEEFGGLIVIADCNLCNPKNLKILYLMIEKEIQRDASVETIYFENNPEACLANVSLRADNRDVENSITNLSRIYNPPKGAIKVSTFSH